GWLAFIGLAGAVVLGVVIAVPIAWFNLSTHLAHALQSESRTGTISRAAQRLRHGFIVAQIALAFILLAGAALLGLSLKKAMAVSPGFRSDHVLTGECTVSWDLQRERVGIVDRLLESIRQQPGIAATGTITNIPLSGDKKDDAQLFTVVGVVGAVKQAALTEAQGQGAVYLPYAYRDNESIFIVTRTSQRPEAFAETLRKLVRAAHPALAVDNIRSMD